MRNQKVADYYDKLYSDDAKVFGGEPLPLVKKLTEHLRSGKILEIGAGAGRNALFLAAKGFDVRAMDISSSAMGRLAAKAREADVKLEVAVSDIAEEVLTDTYDAIICTFTFHHLLGKDAESVIRKIQEHTQSEGFNLITAFTKNGDFYKNHPDTPNFYLESRTELENLYSRWAIITSFEKEGKARSLDTEGKPQRNVFVGLLAQKS